MPKLLRAGTPRGLAAVALGTALVAAACGGDATETSADDESVTEPADGGTRDTDDQNADDPGAASPDAGDPASGDSDGGDSDGEAAAGESADGDESAVEAENLFPDLEVVDIVDGSTVNLSQELFGGDTPVLLWFWAPH